MSTAINNTFPLMPITLTNLNTLQNKSASYPSSENSQDSIILDTMIEPEPNTSWEKGIFIDLYI